MDLENLSLSQVRSNLSGNREIDFIEMTNSSFSITTNCYHILETGSERISFYVWPIKATFHPDLLNFILYDLLPGLSDMPAWKFKKFQYTSSGGLEMPDIRIMEPLAKESVLSEVTMIDPILQGEFGKEQILFNEKILYRELIIKLFPSKEFVEQWIKDGIVYISDKQLLYEWKLKYSYLKFQL